MPATVKPRASASPQAPLPSRWRSLLFWAKTRALQLRRALRDLRDGPRRHRRDGGLAIVDGACAESVTALWPASEETAPQLVAGKIHNLRLAARALHGVEVPAGATFGFWRQLGRATRRRGFVVGRDCAKAAWCRRSAAACASCPMRSTTRRCGRAWRSSSGIATAR